MFMIKKYNLYKKILKIWINIIKNVINIQEMDNKSYYNSL